MQRSNRNVGMILMKYFLLKAFQLYDFKKEKKTIRWICFLSVLISSVLRTKFLEESYIVLNNLFLICLLNVH